MIKAATILILTLVIVVAAIMVWWQVEGRWRPKTITKDQAEIARLLEQSGWVSPHLAGPKLYVVAFRSCPDCIRYWEVEAPRLQKAGVETRVILVARRDDNGVVRSTPAERSTVAELWANRSWDLLTRWQASPVAAWTAPGVIPADNDAARSAVVEQSRQLVDKLQPLLKDNGVDRDGFRYPTLVWWAKDGRMRACACEAAASYRYVRKDLGA
jgi:hypothetical protein